MKAEWFYAKNKQKVEPVTEAQLKELVRSGELTPTDHRRAVGGIGREVQGILEASRPRDGRSECGSHRVGGRSAWGSGFGESFRRGWSSSTGRWSFCRCRCLFWMRREIHLIDRHLAFRF